MNEIHWAGFSGSINTDINEITEDPARVSCSLCLEWMKRNVRTEEPS